MSKSKKEAVHIPSKIQSIISNDYLREIFSILRDLKDPVQIFIHAPHCLKIIGQSETSSTLELVNLSLEYDFARSVCHVLELSVSKLEPSLKNLDRNGHSPSSSESFQDVEFNNILTICYLAVHIISSFSNDSIQFSKDAYDANVIHYLFKILKNPILIHKCINRFPHAFENLLSSAIIGLVNLCRLFSSYSEKWKAEQAIETLLDISEKLKNINDFQLASYIVLANIADDDEIKNFEGYFYRSVLFYLQFTVYKYNFCF